LRALATSCRVSLPPPLPQEKRITRVTPLLSLSLSLILAAEV